MNTQTDPHSGLHNEHGAVAGEHPGRARNPLVKVHDLAWLDWDLEHLGLIVSDFLHHPGRRKRGR